MSKKEDNVHCSVRHLNPLHQYEQGNYLENYHIKSEQQQNSHYPSFCESHCVNVIIEHNTTHVEISDSCNLSVPQEVCDKNNHDPLHV